MRATAKVDYAVRAAVELARAWPEDGSRPVPVSRQSIADAQDIPSKFLEQILVALKRAELVASRRGAFGGHVLTRDPATITMADVIRAAEGPLADVRGERPEALSYGEDMIALQRAWIAVRANLRAVLEQVTLADLRDSALPPDVEALASDPDAWLPH